MTMNIKHLSPPAHIINCINRRTRPIALFAAFTFALLTVFAPVTPAQTQFPDGPGKAIFLKICSNCHGPENVIGKGQSADDWTEVLNKMIQNGAQGTDEEFGAILDYLSTNFPPIPEKINVNTATAWNLRNWMNLSDKQANAVVDYRKQNGDFKSLDDLKKVPGLDAKMLDAKKDRITF
jgi:competence protein ComEA